MIAHVTMNVEDILAEIGVTITFTQETPVAGSLIANQYSYWSVTIRKGDKSMAFPAIEEGEEPPTMEKIVYRMVEEAEVLDYPDRNEWARNRNLTCLNGNHYRTLIEDSNYRRRLDIALNYNWVIGRAGMARLDEAVTCIMRGWRLESAKE